MRLLEHSGRPGAELARELGIRRNQLYRTSFSLSTGFSGFSFDFEALFDNELQVFPNGSSIALDPRDLGFGCTGVGPGCEN